MEDIKLEEIKNLLGKKGNQSTDEQLKDTVVEIKHLIELWLDSFEREIFEGKTLQELLAASIL